MSFFLSEHLQKSKPTASRCRLELAPCRNLLETDCVFCGEKLLHAPPAAFLFLEEAICSRCADGQDYTIAPGLLMLAWRARGGGEAGFHFMDETGVG